MPSAQDARQRRAHRARNRCRGTRQRHPPANAVPPPSRAVHVKNLGVMPVPPARNRRHAGCRQHRSRSQAAVPLHDLEDRARHRHRIRDISRTTLDVRATARGPRLARLVVRAQGGCRSTRTGAPSAASTSAQAQPRIRSAHATGDEDTHRAPAYARCDEVQRRTTEPQVSLPRYARRERPRSPSDPAAARSTETVLCDRRETASTSTAPHMRPLLNEASRENLRAEGPLRYRRPLRPVDIDPDNPVITARYRSEGPRPPPVRAGGARELADRAIPRINDAHPLGARPTSVQTWKRSRTARLEPAICLELAIKPASSRLLTDPRWNIHVSAARASVRRAAGHAEVDPGIAALKGMSRQRTRPRRCPAKRPRQSDSRPAEPGRIWPRVFNACGAADSRPPCGIVAERACECLRNPGCFQAMPHSFPPGPSFEQDDVGSGSAGLETRENRTTCCRCSSQFRRIDRLVGGRGCPVQVGDHRRAQAASGELVEARLRRAPVSVRSWGSGRHARFEARPRRTPPPRRRPATWSTASAAPRWRAASGVSTRPPGASSRPIRSVFTDSSVIRQATVVPGPRACISAPRAATIRQAVCHRDARRPVMCCDVLADAVPQRRISGLMPHDASHAATANSRLRARRLGDLRVASDEFHVRARRLHSSEKSRDQIQARDRIRRTASGTPRMPVKAGSDPVSSCPPFPRIVSLPRKQEPQLRGRLPFRCLQLGFPRRAMLLPLSSFATTTPDAANVSAPGPRCTRHRRGPGPPSSASVSANQVVTAALGAGCSAA